MHEPSLRRRCLAEALGTFALVLIGPGASVVNAWSGGVVTHLGVAAAFGLVVAVAVVALGRVSGAHLNPAVTAGFWAAGRLRPAVAPAYVLSQILGAVTAALLWLLLLPEHIAAAVTLPAVGVIRTLGLEAVMTGLLMLVILQVTARPDLPQGVAAAAIGGTIAFEALVGGPLTGASMNPARSFGPALAAWRWDGHWTYWVGPLFGVLIALPIHAVLHGERSDVP